MNLRRSARRTVSQLRTAPGRSALRSRIRAHRRWSTNRGAFEGSTIVTPVLALGPGRIEASGVQFGYIPSPFIYDGCTHLEARGSSSIRIGAGSVLNNACVLIAEGAGIEIGPDALFGPEVMVFDSDFHGLHPDERHAPAMARQPVRLGANVFVGARSIILKGVQIGDGSVIGAGSVVSGHIPANVIAAGNPCVVLRSFDEGAAGER